LLGAELHQLGGVHLPDGVGLPGPLGGGGGPSPRRRRGQPGALEPSLQGADGGQGPVGEPAVQHHADQTGSPGRMVPPQVHGGSDQRFGGLGCRGPARLVGGDDRRRARPAEAAGPAADGARLEVEGRGDGRDILAGLEAPPDGLTDGHR